jgi:hypothetical protein
MNLEREPVLRGKEKTTDFLLRKKEGKISPEVEGWIREVEKNIHAQRPTVSNYKGQTVLSPARNQPVKITLPLTKTAFGQGLKRGVDEAVRWLSEWCFKSIKKNPRQVVFKQSA